MTTEIRIPCRSIADAKELALRLRADGYPVARRLRTVIARTSTREEGENLVVRLRIDPRSGLWRARDSHAKDTLEPVTGSLLPAGTRVSS